MKPVKSINDFISRFGTSITFNENLVVRKENRFFLLNQNMKTLVSRDFFYAGTYLGKVKDGVFFPSFNLLAMIAERRNANKIFIGEKAEWLFICGRDIFRQGITKVMGSKRRSDYTFVLNQHGECLGFGKILQNLKNGEKSNSQVAVKNISDIGDFLRREKNRQKA